MCMQCNSDSLRERIYMCMATSLSSRINITLHRQHKSWKMWYLKVPLHLRQKFTHLQED
ncbi:hypothetical protein BDL97_17G060400 [Sphagnum fallax]|nr:hypothetical protein BDL97_17G060400 [Sphagnum fallax]